MFYCDIVYETTIYLILIINNNFAFRNISTECYTLSCLYCSVSSSISSLGIYFVVLLLNSSHFMPISADINECDTNPCGENAICKDTIGSFICSCKEDYTGDPFKGCVDINECITLEKPCGTYATCENAVPGYNCLCPQGYRASPSPQIACEQVNRRINSSKP